MIEVFSKSNLPLCYVLFTYWLYYITNIRSAVVDYSFTNTQSI